MQTRRLAWSMLLASIINGCSTSYNPQPTGRVSLVMDDGVLKLDKNGHRQSLGFLGGNVFDAVQGNPEAESHARAYHDLNIAGFATALGSVGAVGAGTGIAAGSDQSQKQLAIGLVLSGLVGVLVGTVLYTTAVPHLYDALNSYNDSVPPTFPGPRGWAAPMPPPPPGTWPPPSPTAAPTFTREPPNNAPHRGAP